MAYWLGQNFLDAFSKAERLGEVFPTRTGLQTGDNGKFVRLWHEVDRAQSSLAPSSADEARNSSLKWFPLNAGGTYRRWFGNNEKVVDWQNDGQNIRKDKLERLDRGEILASNSKPKNEAYYFLPAVTWTRIKSRTFGVRVCEAGTIFDMAGSSVFPGEGNIPIVSAFLNTKICDEALAAINPTVTTQPGDVARFPWLTSAIQGAEKEILQVGAKAIQTAKSDWDAYETSWDFTTLPLLSPEHRGETLAESYATLRAHWQSMTDEMQTLEEENNRIFIDAYGLSAELTPEVPLEEITLTCNPAYRYGVKGSEADRETRLRTDTMAEFLSYAVGCMFGRYSLDAPGLILANQGERLEDYLARVPEPTFAPDADNVIPVLDGDWFPDDITERFRLFLRVTFGEAHFRENLRYIEDALGKDIRKYFTKDFYADHVKRYKKRPIYWMFSSPKGTFNALIYMHRYRGDTVSVILNDYLREFISKLESERGRLEKLSDDPSASQGQRTKALKDMAIIVKHIDELNEWERDVVFPLAQAKIEIDLDDGVKANYPKFGAALKKIPGLEAKDD
ncbi:BREX-1 system adenine-specific DNA-methyltransferase PglX [Rhodovulum sp. P5]|uniref:BREX-1 system adenine-specific DNA-methyltransferase PglX n=1 Tax=Rhodovulum sp. P5 TaxID=1564506 RepID=UPI0020A23841|nr:BREX-1 system adenine-specific DNA-methyltransferase PglX [Rhodovulum sp. P5]